MNNYQTIQSGEPELKDYYNKESVYEAVRRRRKRNLEKEGLMEEEVPDRDKKPGLL